jgi:peptide/nickel transport system substrate-binding protein
MGVFTRACVVVVSVLAVAGCGSSGSGGASAGAARTGAGQSLYDGTRGGALTVLQEADYEHLDPGQAYYDIDYPVVYATQRPLYSYKPNTATQPSPDLAAGPPVISDGGRTVTVHIRTGVRFSPPVNRAVTSADVAYGIERGANPHVANPYFPAYFDYLEGGAQANGGPIAGISTPDPQTIVFHLTGPFAGIFTGALVLPLSAPVPKEFAAKYDAQQPTAYGSSYLVSTGPYMIKSDASGKFLGIGYEPGKSLTLVRNPNWSASSDFRPAYLDQVNVSIGGDPTVIGRQVLSGSNMVQGEPPSSDIVELAYKQYFNQLFAVPGSGNRYVALNNSKGPFVNENLRKAVFAALDREAMVKVRGGKVVEQVGTHFITPGTGGFEQAGGDAGPQTDFNAQPGGSMSVAEKYMKLAGYPSGKYTGGATIKVVGSSDSPNDKDAEIVNQALEQLGFKTNFTLVDSATMLSKYCGVPAQQIDVCPSVAWGRDFNDPQTILDPTFAGYNIVSSNNSNYGQVNDPQINAAMKQAEQVVGDSARAAAWGAIDTQLVSKAVAVPWAWDISPVIESADVRGINQQWNSGLWDYSFTSLAAK